MSKINVEIATTNYLIISAPEISDNLLSQTYLQSLDDAKAELDRITKLAQCREEVEQAVS